MAHARTIIFLLLLSLNSFGLTFSMVKKTPHGLLQKKYSFEDDELLLSNQTNYFEDKSKKIGIGIYRVKNQNDFKAELSLLKNYETTIKKIAQTLNQKKVKYRASDERVYFKINDEVINHLHPLFKDISKVINKIVLNEKLKAVDAFWVNEKQEKVNFRKGNKAETSKLDLTQCKKWKRGHVCTFKDYGIYFVD